ncbi:MAG: 2-dehydropantoate 2-reductase [Clostridia bacterium]|nr:2-dehydropantoate 2-reductase [Clostridia bacterium]
MRAAVFGAGATGTVLGALIAKCGKEIDLITRNKEHVTALNAHGAHISGKTHLNVKVNALLPEESRGKYGLIFLMTKQTANESAYEFIRAHLLEDGVVCTLQNGLPEVELASAVCENRCLGCTATFGATFIRAGEAELTSEKISFALGSPFGKIQQITTVKEYLQCAGNVTIINNFTGARWAKLAINAAFSPLSAITGLTFGQVAADERGRKLALALLNEAFTAAKSNGVKLEKIQGHDIVKLFGCKGAIKRVFALKILPLAVKSHKNIVSGMYFDLKSGKTCEIEYLNGAVVKAAKEGGIAVPLNEKVISLAHEIEGGARKIRKENLNALV